MEPADNKAIAIGAATSLQRDQYRNGLSDRTRTMCVGALVLIWGLFTQKHDEINLSSIHRWYLVKIAAAAIIVLGLDLAEYMMGYFSTLSPDLTPRGGKTGWRRLQTIALSNRSVRQILLHTVTPEAFKRIRKGLLVSKLVCGLAALACLSFVLFHIAPVNAQTQDGDEFKGDWCNGPPDDNVCLVIGRLPAGSLHIEYSTARPPSKTDCQSRYAPDSKQLFATCGDLEFNYITRVDGALVATRFNKLTQETTELLTFLKR